MILELFGLAIHEPDVVFTDLGLALLGGWLGWRLWRRPQALARAGAVIMAGLANAALWGAFFHAFFPERTATPLGYALWLPVAFSIGIAASGLLWLGLQVLMPRLAPVSMRALIAAYAVGFAATVLWVDESFSTLVYLYAPALATALVAALLQCARSRSRGWALITAGFTVCIVASLLQQAKVALHPLYFNHNALYHLIQAAALVLLYRGFLRETDSL